MEDDSRKKHNGYKIEVNAEYFSNEDFIKDCPNYPFIPSILPKAKRIIAIGDIHGDMSLAIKSFKLASLIDDDYNWIADPPETIVVQVGDQVDSCRPIPNVYNCHKKKYDGDKADDLNVINFFDDMHKKASSVGGAVYSLMGNHEYMNSQAEFKYVSYDNYYNFKYKDKNGKLYEGPSGRRKAFKTGGPLARHLACSRNSVIVIGSNMFVHAGVLPILATRLKFYNIDSGSKIKYLNAIFRKWLLRKLSEDENKVAIDLINNSKYSPFWTRIFGSIPNDTDLESGKCFDSVKKALEVYNVGHIIVGHTPQLFTNEDGINGTCYEKKNKNDKKLYRVDGGFARAFKIFDKQELVQVLEIIDDNIFNILTDKTIETNIEEEKPSSINISDKFLKNISSMYSQNRTSKKEKRKNGFK